MSQVSRTLSSVGLSLMCITGLEAG